MPSSTSRSPPWRPRRSPRSDRSVAHALNTLGLVVLPDGTYDLLLSNPQLGEASVLVMLHRELGTSR